MKLYSKKNYKYLIKTINWKGVNKYIFQDMRKVIIFGKGAFLQIIHPYLKYDPTFHMMAFPTNEKFIQENVLYKLSIVPFEIIEQIIRQKSFACFLLWDIHI